MKWVFSFLKPLSKRITVGTTIKTIGTVAELIIPFLLSYILENVIKENNIGKIIFFLQNSGKNKFCTGFTETARNTDCAQIN